MQVADAVVGGGPYPVGAGVGCCDEEGIRLEVMGHGVGGCRITEALDVRVGDAVQAPRVQVELRLRVAPEDADGSTVV